MKTIDLHGVRHKDVSDVMCRCCSEYETPFIAITGNSSNMKKIVKAIAENFGLIAVETLGNSGRLVIKEKA